jgi:hypothetical protein
MTRLSRVYLVVTVLLLVGGAFVTTAAAQTATPTPAPGCAWPVPGNLVSNGLFNPALPDYFLTTGTIITVTSHPCGFGNAIDLPTTDPASMMIRLDALSSVTSPSRIYFQMWIRNGYASAFLVGNEPLGYVSSSESWQFVSSCSEIDFSGGSQMYILGDAEITGVALVPDADCDPLTPLLPTPTPLMPTATPTATPEGGVGSPPAPTPGPTPTPDGAVGTPPAPTLTPAAALLPPPIPTQEMTEMQPITPIPGVYFDTAPVSLPEDEGYDFSGWGVPALPEAIEIPESDFYFEIGEIFEYENVVLVFQIVRTYPLLISRFPGWMYVIFAVVIVISLRFFIGVATQRKQAAAAEEREAAREEREALRRERL